MFILDFGSGETCNNDLEYAFRMIDSVPRTDKDVVIKWQLFENIPPLLPLSHEVYIGAKMYANTIGVKTGASFFDNESLGFLLDTKADFVKMAARPHLYYLLKHVPEWMPLIVSVPDFDWYVRIRQEYPRAIVLCCVAKYPANPTEYENIYSHALHYGISDHTKDWYLYKEYEPVNYECHFCLDDSTGPDAAEFARRPKQLEEVL